MSCGTVPQDTLGCSKHSDQVRTERRGLTELRPVYRRVISVAAAVLATSWAVGAPRAAAVDSATSATAAGLDEFFTADDAAGLAGADYPHAYSLPDGRTLWLFQDAFIGADDQLGDDRFAHNAAVVQSGTCFELLPTSGGNGTSWIGSWVESGLRQWFWPLDAEVGADGYLWLFLAEVHNPNGRGAASGAEPVATWRARYRLPDLELVDLEPAADASRSLFGYAIVSDDAWTYLFGHCYRQYVSDGAGGFDPACSPYTYLARVPRGELDHDPEYWSGAGWTVQRSARQPVLTGQHSLPVSVERFGDVYVAASDDDEWFGSDVVIRTAPAPQGPWTEVLRYTPETRCAACNNYGAFILPHLEDGRVVIAHSNNAWDMRGDAFGDASLYRIGVRAVQVPGVPAPSSVVAAEQTRRVSRRCGDVRARRPAGGSTAGTPVARDGARWLAAPGVGDGGSVSLERRTCCGPCGSPGSVSRQPSPSPRRRAS